MTEICLYVRERDTFLPCPLPCMGHSRRQTVAPSLWNGTVLQAFLEAQIRAKKKSNQQSTFGAKRGALWDALWDADPPGCVDYSLERMCGLFPATKAFRSWNHFRDRSCLIWKLGSMWAQILGAEPISAFISCLFICSWGFGRSSGAAGGSLEGRK